MNEKSGNAALASNSNFRLSLPLRIDILYPPHPPTPTPSILTLNLPVTLTLTFKLLDTLTLRRPQVLRCGWKLFLRHHGRIHVPHTSRLGQGGRRKRVSLCVLARDMCSSRVMAEKHITLPFNHPPTHPQGG